MCRLGSLGWIMASSLTLHAATAAAQCSAPLTAFQALGSTIGVTTDGSLPPQVIDQALALWSSCANYGSGFPVFLSGPVGTRNVTVTYLWTKNIATTCGTFAGSTIKLYEYYTDRNGRLQRCGSLAQNLAHELGHVLGLDDSPSGTNCQGTIMAPLTVVNERRRKVSPEECSLAGQKWLTTEEQQRLAGQERGAPYEFHAARLAPPAQVGASDESSGGATVGLLQ